MTVENRNKSELKINDQAVVVEINGSTQLQQYLLSNGVGIGSTIIKNYSPKYAQLVNFTVNGKMLSLRKSDFDKIVTQQTL